MSNYRETLRNYANYLSKSNYNVVARNMPCSSFAGFTCEILSPDERFFMKIRVDEDIECAIVEIYPGIRVPEPYRDMTAEYCARQVDNNKLGNLRISEQNDLYSHVATSFKDAPLSEETIRKMEIAALIVLADANDIDRVAHGHLPSETADSWSDRLKRLRLNCERALREIDESSDSSEE